MASYSNSAYSNSLFDLTGVYFNPTSQSRSSSAVDLDALDARYLIKSSGGTITNNLIVAGSVDIQTSLTLPTIGNVENTIQGKQDEINTGDLSITDTNGLEGALNAKYDKTGGQITGNATITGDLIVGTTNIITEIGTKQDEINTGDLAITDTNGLEGTLNAKYDKTGGTIDGNATITGDLIVGTTNIITEIGTKQDTIQDADLTIAKTSGLQTALDDKYDKTGGTIDGNATITGDLIVGTTNIITEIGTKQATINDGDLTIARTNGLQTALDNKYDDTGGTINGNATITGDLIVGTTNIITEIGTKQDEINTGDLAITDTAGLESALNAKYDKTGGTITGNATITGDLVVGTTNIITEIGTKQDEIGTGDLAITDTNGLEGALEGKQPTIDSSVSVSCDTLTTVGNATIGGDIVNSALTTALNAKQPNITPATDLSFNSITTNDLVVNESLNIDNILTYDTLDFDTIVIRRVSDNQTMNLRELQLWVNNDNILPDIIIVSENEAGNDLGETPEFFNNSTNKTEQASNSNQVASNIANDGIPAMETATDTVSIGTGTANNSSLYIPLTTTINIKDIQSLVLYNTSRSNFSSRTRGLRIELYNRTNDSTLSSPLAFTNTIETTDNVYRFDFPAISTYSGSFVGDMDSNSTTDILDITPEIVSITQNPVIINTDISMTGDLTISGDLVVGTTNVITEIGTKQATIQDGDLTIAKTNGLQTALDNKYDDTGGTITGNATITGDLVVGTTNIITELGTKQDEIGTGDLAITDTNGLQTALNNKQDTITNFEVNGNVSLDTTGNNFDTLIIRRPSGITGLTDDYVINLIELQLWVNDANILVQNASSLISSVVSFSNKEVDIGFERSPTFLYNGLLDNTSGELGVITSSPSPTDIAIIIKNIPLTKINDIHTIQVYNRNSTTLGLRAIGLAFELYNSINDPSLNTILAQTNEITERYTVYRFDFPSIGLFTLGMPSGGILPDTGAYANLVERNDAIVLSFPFNVIGDLTISGVITAPNQPCFKAKVGNTGSASADVTIRYNSIVIDTDNGYNTSTSEYTIKSAGTWFFYYGFFSQGGDNGYTVQLQQNGTLRDEVRVTSDTTAVFIFNTIEAKGMAIIPCVVNDTIRVKCVAGIARFGSAGEFHTFGGFRIG